MLDPTFQAALVNIAYLVAASLFILGLKRQQTPATARGGNMMAASGMLLAVVVTLLSQRIITPGAMIIGLVVGGVIGAVLARRVEMTGMPELVAAFNGFGGLASTLVAGAELARYLVVAEPGPFGGGAAITLALSILIGTVTFSGSFVAYGKLSGKVSGNPISFPGMRVVSFAVLLGVVAMTAVMALDAEAFPAQTGLVVTAALVLAGLSLVLGVLLVIPIGGADMPVVVALLNSYSGLAAAATGFVLDNTVLIVSGTLVGAAGLILTRIMCEAMNRSLTNVLLGGFGGDAVAEVGPAADDEGRTINETSAEDVAIMLAYADQVIVVPGYGMAVAQAQHQVRELADLLQKKGVRVKYAIHPVAGRMPGHMNVLLAEANVSYDVLYEMDEVNGDFNTTDVSLVIGANDVVNPAARTDQSSPIYGMP
ncbi:MAG: NAD(P)(+) transhydrogenase (Re/Si-specific) subunit beta, partial [Rhodothermales bacterium]